MAIRQLTLVSLAVALCLIATGGNSRHELLAASPEALTVPLPMAQDACVDCADNPEYCPENNHDAWDGTADDWNRNGGAHSGTDPCKSGSCDTKHGLGGCSLDLPEALTNADLELLRLKLVVGDFGEIRRILASHGNQVRVNSARSAIQVANCKGAIIAHMPLTSALMGGIVTHVLQP